MIKRKRNTYRDDEGIANACHRVRDLEAQLLVVVVNPATIDYRNPIEGGNASLSE